MIRLSPSDQAALEIGRLFLRAHAAEQRAAEAEAKLAEAAQVESPSARARKPTAGR